MTKDENSNTLSKNYLSIQISLDALAFCIYDVVRNAVVDAQKLEFGATLTQQEMFNRMKTFLKDTHVKNQSFSEVTLIYKNRFSTFVPKELFHEDLTENYIKYNTPLDGQEPTYEELKNYQLINVFLPNKQIDNYIESLFGSFRRRHYYSIIIKSLFSTFRENTQKNLFISLEEYGFALTILENGQLFFHNTFTAHTTNDFLYYLLFVCKQLKIETDKVILFFMNIDIENPYFKMSKKYFSNINLFNAKVKVPIAYNINNTFLERYYVLLNSF